MMHLIKYALVVISLVTVSTAIGQVAETVDVPPALELGGDEAAIYFYRPNRAGGAINFWGFVDDTVIGVVRGRQYVAGIVSAGEHVVWARSGNVSASKMNLRGGESYYIRMGTRMGGLRARVVLVPEDAEAFQDDLNKLNYRELTSEGVERSLEIIETDYEEALERADEEAET